MTNCIDLREMYVYLIKNYQGFQFICVHIYPYPYQSRKINNEKSLFWWYKKLSAYTIVTIVIWLDENI